MIGENMKKLKYFLLAVFLIFSFNVKALECDTKELNRLKELAKKIEFDYDYTVVDGAANFSIRVVNMNEELKVSKMAYFVPEGFSHFNNT